MTRLSTLLAALLALSSTAQAQLLIPVSQEREAFSFAEGDNLYIFLSDSDSTSAPDFAPFSASSSAAIEQPGEVRVDCGSSMNSEIFPDGIHADASCFGNSEISGGDLWIVGGAGSALVSVDFQVPAALRYELSGSVLGLDSGCVRSSLREVGGAFLFSIDTLIDGSGSVSESGLLTPGVTYRFSIIGNGGTALESFGSDFGDAIFDVEFNLTALVENYCTAAPNSVGAGAVLGNTGSLSVAANDFGLEATGAIPGGTGLFYYGSNRIQVPFADGFRCVGGMTFRLQPPVQANGTGTTTRSIDFNASPTGGGGAGAILPDSSWNFQLWYRDTTGPGGTGSNLSDGLSVRFSR